MMIMFTLSLFGGEYQVTSLPHSSFMLCAIGVGMRRNSVPPTFAQWGSGRNILSFFGAVPIQHMLGGNYVPTDLQELLSWGKAHGDGRATQFRIFFCYQLRIVCRSCFSARSHIAPKSVTADSGNESRILAGKCYCP